MPDLVGIRWQFDGRARPPQPTVNESVAKTLNQSEREETAAVFREVEKQFAELTVVVKRAISSGRTSAPFTVSLLQLPNRTQ